MRFLILCKCVSRCLLLLHAGSTLIFFIINCLKLILIKGNPSRTMINLTINRHLYPSIFKLEKHSHFFPLSFSQSTIPIYEKKRSFPWKSKKKSQDLFLDLIVWCVFFFDMFSFAPHSLKNAPRTTQETDTNSIELKKYLKRNRRRKYLKSKNCCLRS